MKRLNDLLNIANEYMRQSGCDFTSNGNYREYTIKILNKVRASSLIYNPHHGWDLSRYERQLKDFFGSYEEFKSLVQSLRTEIDIL